MKEKTLLEIKKKVDALTNVVQHVFKEIGSLRELSVGTLETLKLIDGYSDAIEILKERVASKAPDKQEKIKNK